MISIIPMGEINENVLKYLQRELKIIFARGVKILPQVKISQDAYNGMRKQYNAKALLETISVDSPNINSDKILGLTDKDMYAPELNYVFGSVEKIGGKKGIISITRLCEEFYHRQADEGLFLKRILKEAIHELGHLHGIPHCGNSECVMHFSYSILDSDNKGDKFCHACQVILNSKSINVGSLRNRRL